VVIPDCLVLPVDLLIWVVEGVMATHLEYEKVPPRGWADVIQVREPQTRLADDKRIRRWWNYTFCHERLEIKYGRAD